jgi:predicted lipoprotein with Yx(FWY)xxD motif
MHMASPSSTPSTPRHRAPSRAPSRRYRTITALSAVAMAGALLATACAKEDSGSGPYDADQVGAEQPANDDYSSGDGYGSDYGDGDGSDTAAQLGDPAGELAVAETADLGEVVTDSEGFTLYRFEQDTADPPSSACADDCAATWPPVPADDVTAAEGIDPELLGQVERDDGTWQLTLNGWPVYRYVEDTAPGDTNGHGVGGTWNALAPDGSPAGQQAEDSGSEETEEDLPALSVVEDTELGPIVRDAEGRTLYRFDNDVAWPMETNCTGDCLDLWKPAAPVDPADVEGIDPELVNTFERPDGTEQLAIDCWILYWYTGDEEPGDTNGHGAQGLWWAVQPNGTKAATP